LLLNFLARVALAGVLMAAGLVVPVAAPRAAAASLPLVGLVQLDADISATCGVFSSGAVACWGHGDKFGLGNGSSANRSAPTAVVGISTAVTVAVGASFACALLAAGTVQCWGDNMFGQLGTGGFGLHATPVAVPGLSGIIQLDAGLAHVCAVQSNGQVKCWGANSSGQLSQQPSQIGSPTPTLVAGLSGVAQVAAGGNHTCARKTDGTVRCWGQNSIGQVGIGSYSPFIVVPTSPSSLTGVLDISAGYGHTCVIADTVDPVHVVRCLGQNDSQQLGSETISNVPKTLTANVGSPVDVDASGQNSCVVNAAGGVLCWGDNSGRQLGNNSGVERSAAPVAVTGIGDAEAVAVGAGWSCALLEGQLASCWGQGYAGRLGRGSDSVGAIAAPVVTPFAEYVSVNPARVLDTRPAGVTIDGVAQKSGVVAGGATLQLQLRSRGGVPSNGVSVTLNLTTVASAGAGWATVWPCNETKPNASNLNFLQGVTRANMVVGRIATSGPDTGKVCISPSVNTHLIVDVMGYYRPGSEFTAISPARMFDSRPTGITVDGAGQASGMLSPSTVMNVAVAGRGGVPADAKAVAFNFTSVSGTGAGVITVWPCNVAQPITGNLSVQAGITAANVVVSALSSGHVCFRSTVATHVVVDVVGYHSSSTDLQTPPPVRISDSRPGATTVDGQSKSYGKLAAGATVKLKVVSRWPDGPSVARSVVVGLTVVAPAAYGYVTVYPCGTLRPNASNLNMTAGVSVSATAMVTVGDDNSVCIYSSVATHLVVESFGFYFF